MLVVSLGDEEPRTRDQEHAVLSISGRCSDLETVDRNLPLGNEEPGTRNQEREAISISEKWPESGIGLRRWFQRGIPPEAIASGASPLAERGRLARNGCLR